MKKNIRLNNENYEVDILEQTSEEVKFNWNGKTWKFELRAQKLWDENSIGHDVLSKDRHFWIDSLAYEDQTGQKKKRHSRESSQPGSLLSPMPGKILKLYVEQGQSVKQGDPLLVMEAMKMEHTIKSLHDGIIEKVPYAEGEQVLGGVELIVVTEQEK
jgi:3-methylcrotonyl-CoA carboxylase alpha subunit